MILVFGKTGQVARELAPMLPDAHFAARSEADLSRPDECAALVRKLKPAGVINAAAYTAVDKAEDEEELASLVNGEAPGAIAAACAEAGIPLIHISTDYVFAGEGDHFHQPGDEIAPPNAYGRTKAAGEAAVRASGAGHAIIRTSWVFSPHGNNFVKTMLRLGSERDSLRIVADQIGGPTPAAAIAEACVRSLAAITADKALCGTYHLSGAPDVSWADFAREIFAQAGMDVEVADIPSAEFPTPAKRPLNSRLDCSSLERLGLERPDWRLYLKPIIEEFAAS
ncbi:dTDP-4-dehydrorhamnose reductase [Qipengyuania sp. 1NDW9]|uniref:dTDP-4-dehydrorhamnose reductase n=1 Tax=Qipengyuania xiapuensis TaxID=2867236 RepID=UPI001C87ED69|nr:dTDP-4-dehydrorhamnose reductase [Qipengyuania xiapuensis]MBX7492963.1 dTDP-4-dehydrorhamnose reductase [Qipengyuania xiapuensis]